MTDPGTDVAEPSETDIVPVDDGDGRDARHAR